MLDEITNQEFTSDEDAARYIKEKMQEQIEKDSEELLRIISIVSKSMRVVETGSGIVSAECGLDNMELQVCAMKIPAICTFLQAKLSALSLHSSLDETLIDLKISQAITNTPKGRENGTASERAKKAELSVSVEKMANVAEKQYVRAIQDLIHRADKVYEGIKKTIDYRARELWFDQKNPA